MSSTAWQPQGWDQQQGRPPQPQDQVPQGQFAQGQFAQGQFPQAPFPPAPPWGAPQAAPAQWSAPTHPGPKTNLLALLSILAAASGATILLGVGSIAAIVMGLLALGQIRRTGEDGRLLALWAVIVGAVTLVALTFATVIGVAAFVRLIEQVPGTGF